MGLTCSCKTCGNRNNQKKRRNKRRIATDSRQTSSSTTETSHNDRSSSKSPQPTSKERSIKRLRISVPTTTASSTELLNQPKQENIYYEIPAPPIPTYTPLSTAEEVIEIQTVSRSYMPIDSIIEPDIIAPERTSRLESSNLGRKNRLSIPSISSSCVDLAGGFLGSDLPLKPFGDGKPNSDGSSEMSEEAIKMCLNKPSFWVQEVEMRLKYLEGQTDSHLSNFNDAKSVYDSHIRLNKDQENTSDEINQMVDSIKNRLSQFENQFGEDNSGIDRRRQSLLNDAMGIDNLMRRLHKKNVTLLDRSSRTRKSTDDEINKCMESIEASKESVKRQRNFLEMWKKNQTIEKKEVSEARPEVSKWKQLKERQKAMDIAKVFKSRPFKRPEEPPIGNRRPKFDPAKAKELLERTRLQIDKTKNLIP